MAQSDKYFEIFKAYADAFPDAVMFDSRGMAGEDFDRLEEMMQTALDRGSPMTEDDLLYPIVEADPETGTVL